MSVYPVTSERLGPLDASYITQGSERPSLTKISTVIRIIHDKFAFVNEVICLENALFPFDISYLSEMLHFVITILANGVK